MRDADPVVIFRKLEYRSIPPAAFSATGVGFPPEDFEYARAGQGGGFVINVRIPYLNLDSIRIGGADACVGEVVLLP